MLSSLFAAALVSLISLVGVLLIFNLANYKKYMIFLIALAAGTFLGDVFLHMLPEAIAETNDIGLITKLMLLGIVTLFLLEKVLHWHSHSHDHEGEESGPKSAVVVNITIGDAIHNFWDGVAIAASFAVSTELGIAMTVAIILHEIPQEIADLGILISAGYSRYKAILVNLFTAFMAFLGVFAFQLFSTQITEIRPATLAITSGIFLYIAVADLLPEIRETDKKKSLMQALVFGAGILVMFLLTLIEA